MGSTILASSRTCGLMVRDARRCVLLTMRISDLILRSIANGSRECAPDDRLRDASRRMKRRIGRYSNSLFRDRAARRRLDPERGGEQSAGIVGLRVLEQFRS